MELQTLQERNEALQKEQKELGEKLNAIRDKAVKLATYIFGFCPLLPSGEIDFNELENLVNKKLDEIKKKIEAWAILKMFAK